MTFHHLLRALARTFFSVAILALGAATVAAGERIEPPLELLYMPGNILVAGPLVEINPQGRLVFARKEVLGGAPRPPDLIDVRAPPSVLTKVKVGDRYIFGYQVARPDPRNPTRTIADPKGAVLIGSIGLEPALFRDTPAARAILKAGRSEHGRESRALFDLLLRALADDDPPLQNLAAGQISQDLEMHERMHDRERAIVEKVARAAGTPANVRATLLLAAATRPAEFGNWWQPASLEVVTSTPLGGYAQGASDPTSLVLLAFEVLGQHAVPVAPEVLKRWLSSASPALAEHACLMLQRQFPAQERPAIQHALADPALPEKTRKFLNDRVRNLDRRDAVTNGRKAGAP